ncbi:MAG: glycine zipper 2TM domain-containing protein [Xanthomonadales bacterium]|nr:glycine zipper 2TM domain-containing protein [Xanthomonadales bacterium]
MKRAGLRSFSLVTAAFALVCAGAGAASADGGGYGPAYDYARVVEVRPIIESYREPVRSEQCWSEPVTYREPDRYRGGSRDRAPAILGGIIGGAIGNQFGSGSGRDAATLAGAALGYAAVRDSQRHRGGYIEGREYTRYEDRCRVVTDYRREDRVVGYDVAYRYRGRTHWTRTDFHPGDRIQVEIDVRPVPY